MVKTGTIVKCKYNDFDGIERVGLFLILYSELEDNNTQYRGNFVGAKITTQFGQCMNYVYPLKHKYFDFLDKDCCITLSKLHTIGMQQINLKKNVLGVLDEGTMVKVYKEFMRFERELNRQLESKM